MSKIKYSKNNYYSKNKVSIIILIGICFLIILSFYYNYIYLGDYTIERQWISSFNEKSGTKYCDNCLWIEFNEGCNRYLIYYFENQFILDDRFGDGDIVNINWKDCEDKKCINGITPAIKYRNKCS